MSEHSTQFRSIEFKLYLTVEQQQTLDRWLRLCCRTYNTALEERIRVYRETGKGRTYHDQQANLTQQRKTDAELQVVPVEFARDALRRVDRGMQAFFRRCKAGEKKVGFPRFRSQQRYNSLECSESNCQYVYDDRIRIPKIGLVKARGPFGLIPAGPQKLLRVIRRASGWYAQVLIEVRPEPLPKTGQECGIDLGLTHFLTLDTGEQVGNPRLLRKAANKLRAAQKRLSRRVKGSGRYRKAKRQVGRCYERVKNKRKGFCHRISRGIVNRFDGIALEDLKVANMARGHFAKSILDAAWSLFGFYLTFKAVSAGRSLVKVDPRGTSQECPSCGTVVRKELSQRVHDCPCGCRMDRDKAAAIIIKTRAFGRGRGEPLRPAARALAGSVKRNGAL